MRHPPPCQYDDSIGNASPLADFCSCPKPTQIVRPEPYGGYAVKHTHAGLWPRVRARARVIFSVDRTPHEMALIFEALQDANLRIEALQQDLLVEIAQRKEDAA